MLFCKLAADKDLSFVALGKGDLIPSVFALWGIPDWLPRIWLKHFAVSKYIMGGADVMLPGVHVPNEGLPEPFKEGDCVSICVPGNPAPIAVGCATMSSRSVNIYRTFEDARSSALCTYQAPATLDVEVLAVCQSLLRLNSILIDI